jgi:inositol phosphorylceramide mannosyltransferase catalytic subunit
MASSRVRFLSLACACFLLLYRWWLPLVSLTSGLLLLPVRWRQSSWSSFISNERDHFDVTFSSYEANQSSSVPEYPDLVPPILHHINLGTRPPRAGWLSARSNCLRHHEGWEFRLWDDANAGAFVQENFPELKHMWDHYPHPVQRVDALRYMVLYKYGGMLRSTENTSVPSSHNCVSVQDSSPDSLFLRSGSGFRSRMQAVSWAVTAIRLRRARCPPNWILYRHAVSQP